MKIEAGEAAMATSAFADLFNRYVFIIHYPGPAPPLAGIRVRAEREFCSS